jgi:hypothetical protein
MDENEVDLQDIVWIYLKLFNLARGSNMWRPSVYVVMPFCVPKLFDIDLKLLMFEEELCCLKLFVYK